LGTTNTLGAGRAGGLLAPWAPNTPTLHSAGQLFAHCPQSAAPEPASAPIPAPWSTAQFCPGFVTQVSLLGNMVPIIGADEQTLHGGVQLIYQLESRDHKNCLLL